MLIQSETKTTTVQFILYDDIRFYRDKRGYWIGNVKREGGKTKAKRLHIYVWEKYNGEIPADHHVHHIDHNSDNNEIDNLMLMPKFEHLSLHGKIESTKAKARRIFESKVRPKAIAWHKSEAGREQARKNRKLVNDKWMEEIVKICIVCGEKYVTYKNKEETSKFCSNNCKAKRRRMSEVDDITKECIICHEKYTANRYYKGKTCSNKCKQIYKRILKEND